MMIRTNYKNVWL